MHDENTDKSNKNINVSNEFVDIFKNFNVVNKVEEMKLLSKKELYLLLTLCLDKHDDGQPTVVYNFQQFREEVMELFEIQDDKETLNPVLQELIKESGDKYIETDGIVDEMGNKLPEPLTKEGVRDAKIDIINSDDSK
jgi:Fe-S-cluster formation regulator IscX/YfhJ